QEIESAVEPFLREKPRGPCDKLHPRWDAVELRLIRDPAVERLVEGLAILLLVALLHAAKRDAFFDRNFLDLFEHVMDHAMGRRGDADLPALAQQAHDQTRAGVGLPRSRWPLNHERALVQF